MACGNPIKNKLQIIFYNWLDMSSFDRKLSDEQMECMQFGTCDMLHDMLRRFPFFIIGYT